MGKVIQDNQKVYFYFKDKKKISASTDKRLNVEAKKKLDALYAQSNELKIPQRFIHKWDQVALYHPGGDVDKANSILIDPENGAYSIKNKLNEMTGKEWIKFTCSWFIFNALAKDLKQEKELDPNTEHHPATFSPTMIESFVEFFTKSGDNVIDPFLGIGSTTEACARTGRNGYGTELNPKYYELAVKRNPEFKENIHNTDALNIKDLKLPKMQFSISSPPYWDILNRSTKDFKSKRDKSGFDINYSDSSVDLGNIDDYQKFLEAVCDVYLGMYDVMDNGSHIVIIVKNVKKGGRMYPLAWDIASKLSEKYTLKDEKLWIQDKVALAPYGYPNSWASNILHHYCLILRKE